MCARQGKQLQLWFSGTETGLALTPEPPVSASWATMLHPISLGAGEDHRSGETVRCLRRHPPSSQPSSSSGQQRRGPAGYRRCLRSEGGLLIPSGIQLLYPVPLRQLYTLPLAAVESQHRSLTVPPPTTAPETGEDSLHALEVSVADPGQAVPASREADAPHPATGAAAAAAKLCHQLAGFSSTSLM